MKEERKKGKPKTLRTRQELKLLRLLDVKGGDKKLIEKKISSDI